MLVSEYSHKITEKMLVVTCSGFFGVYEDLCLFLSKQPFSCIKKTELCHFLVRLPLLKMLHVVTAFWRHLTNFCVAGSHTTSSCLRLKFRIGLRRELT